MMRISALAPVRAAAVATALLVAGCATPPTDPEERIAYDEANDPMEPLNRVIFERNRTVDRNVLRPVAQAYVDLVPDDVRHGVHNVLANFDEPFVTVNLALQGNFDQAWTTVERFAVNTTAGGLGVADVASGWDLPHYDADFGQTFGVWGIGEGPYLMLPLFGPSNPRDAAGLLVGFLLDPLNYVGGPIATSVSVARFGLKVVDRRSAHLADLDELERNSLDYYATLRSLYRQRRGALIDRAKGSDGGSPGAPPASDPAASPTD
jgi:phospholipid-binding lipoprotein MlaA